MAYSLTIKCPDYQTTKFSDMGHFYFIISKYQTLTKKYHNDKIQMDKYITKNGGKNIEKSYDNSQKSNSFNTNNVNNFQYYNYAAFKS